jgi:hypothetical protein
MGFSCTGLAFGSSRERKVVFFEKKKQKTFANQAAMLKQAAPISKSFLVLFFQKRTSPMLATGNGRSYQQLLVPVHAQLTKSPNV